MSELPLSGGIGQPKWTLADGATEIRRELHVRERVYPTLIARGQLTQAEADRQNRRLQGTLRFLEFCANNGLFGFMSWKHPQRPPPTAP